MVLYVWFQEAYCRTFDYNRDGKLKPEELMSILTRNGAMKVDGLMELIQVWWSFEIFIILEICRSLKTQTD